MANVIVNATNKGGEGKTTCSILLAEYCSIRLGLKTLLIDMDPQANCSSVYLKMEYNKPEPNQKDSKKSCNKIPPIHPEYDPDIDKNWNGRSSIAGIFYGEPIFPYVTRISNLEIIPADGTKLLEAELVTKNEVTQKVHERLKQFLANKDVQEAYDVIIIDTPPTKGPLTIASLRAASYMVIPTGMEKFSIQGIQGMLQLWLQETYQRTKNNPIKLIGILPNRIKRVKLHKENLAQLSNMHSTSKMIIPHQISDRIIYSSILEDSSSPRSIFHLAAEEKARQESEKVCGFIMKEVGL